MKFKSLTAAALLLSATSAAQASVITISASQAIQGRPGAAGLAGTYVSAPADSTGFTIEDTLEQLRTVRPTGTFISTAINYGGGDASTIGSFLGADGASYTGHSPAGSGLSDTIIDLSGYLYVPVATTIDLALSHDDSARLKIGGRVVVSADCCGTDTATVAFEKAGFYAVDLIYSNSVYQGGVGAASLALTRNGAVLTSAGPVAALVQSVPEPASLTMLGGTLALLLTTLGLARRRSAPANP